MAATKDATKKKKRNWYQIVAPKQLRNALLGESLVDTKDRLIGKTMKLNVSTFTNDMKKQNIDAYFMVSTITENHANADLTGISLTNSYVKRLVRRGKTKVEDSFLAKSKDGKILRVKPVAITNSRTDKSVSSRIRLEMRSILRNLLKGNNSEDFLADLIMQKHQKEIKETLSKIYPLKFVDIRIAKVDNKAVFDEEKETAAPKKQAPKPKKKKIEIEEEETPVEETVEDAPKEE